MIIKPLPCDGTNASICVSPGDKVTIYNKIGGRLEIPVLRSLEMENIVIDSSDSNIDFPSISTCLEDKIICCTQVDIEDGTCSLRI